MMGWLLNFWKNEDIGVFVTCVNRMLFLLYGRVQKRSVCRN